MHWPTCSATAGRTAWCRPESGSSSTSTCGAAARRKGVVNLNWRLILAPPAVFEYVVVHELCHLRQPHHKAAFWRLVGQVLPGFEDQRRWLRANGHLLTLRPGDGP